MKNLNELKNYTVKEFATKVNENTNTIQKLVWDATSISNTTNPVDNLIKLVNKAEVNDSNKEIIVAFLYTTLYNQPITPFRNGRGFGLEIR
jgi:hypothetical protein